MKNILITGGCGFIGSNFINYIFNKNNYNIFNIDAMYYCSSEKNIDENIRKDKRYKFIKGNTSSYDLIYFILTEYNIDIIINFAANSHVDLSFNESLRYTNDNIIGTHTLLEACKNYGKINRIIHISTDEVYGESNFDDNYKNEISLLEPTNPYSATKASAEMICFSYIKSFKLPIIITRSNNIYGKNQYPEKLIPKFIKLLVEDKKVTIHGNGLNVRGFLFIEDICSALEIILNKGKIGNIYNIGCEDEFSVLEIAKKLIKKIKNTNDYNKWIEYIEDRPFNDKRYYINNDKVKQLGWEIKWKFDEGLNTILPYYITKFKLN